MHEIKHSIAMSTISMVVVCQKCFFHKSHQLHFTTATVICDEYEGEYNLELNLQIIP